MDPIDDGVLAFPYRSTGRPGTLLVRYESGPEAAAARDAIRRHLRGSPIPGALHLLAGMLRAALGSDARLDARISFLQAAPAPVPVRVE